jgi:hypothetical protein
MPFILLGNRCLGSGANRHRRVITRLQADFSAVVVDEWVLGSNLLISGIRPFGRDLRSFRKRKTYDLFDDAGNGDAGFLAPRQPLLIPFKWDRK